MYHNFSIYIHTKLLIMLSSRRNAIQGLPSIIDNSSIGGKDSEEMNWVSMMSQGGSTKTRTMPITPCTSALNTNSGRRPNLIAKNQSPHKDYFYESWKTARIKLITKPQFFLGTVKLNIKMHFMFFLIERETVHFECV